MAVAAAVLEIAIAPRTYSYPKLIVYAAGILLLWRYIDQPSNRRAVRLAVATTLAFYLRHDHGLYLGLVTIAVIAMRHARSLRTAMQQMTVFAAGCVLMVAPFFAYPGLRQRGGIRPGSSSVFRTGTLGKPICLARVAPVDRRQHRPVDERTRPRGANQYSMDGFVVSGNPPAGAIRYRLQVSSAGPLESGRFTLYGPAPQTGRRSSTIRPSRTRRASIERPARCTTGWYLGPIRLLNGLDTAAGSAAFLFFVFLLVPAVAAAVLLGTRRPEGPLGQWERVKIAAVVLVAIVTFAGFVREALDARIGDAVVAPVILGAWLCAGLLGGRPSAWGRFARVAVLALLMIPVTRSVVVAGARAAVRACGAACRRVETIGDEPAI